MADLLWLMRWFLELRFFHDIWRSNRWILVKFISIWSWDPWLQFLCWSLGLILSGLRDMNFQRSGCAGIWVFSRWRLLGFMRWTFCLKGIDMFFVFITTCRHVYSCRYVSFKLTKHVDRFIPVMRWVLRLAPTYRYVLLELKKPVDMFILVDMFPSSLPNMSTCSSRSCAGSCVSRARRARYCCCSRTNLSACSAWARETCRHVPGSRVFGFLHFLLQFCMFLHDFHHSY